MLGFRDLGEVRHGWWPHVVTGNLVVEADPQTDEHIIP